MPFTNSKPPRLPKGWPATVQAAMIHVIALAQYAIAYTRSWAANSPNERIRLASKVERLEQEVALLREKIRIKDIRMASIPAAKRPHYGPTESFAILQLRAVRCWSLEQTARVFQVTAATIASWGKRLDEQGTEGFLQSPEPVNKFPDFVREIVQRLQALNPHLGKVKIAQILARAGLHLAANTVGRMRREPPIDTSPPTPKPDDQPTPTSESIPSTKRVTAKCPNHIWHLDLTVVPTALGLWTTWLPFALPQCWPFCYWVAAVVDQYSRRVQGFVVFKKQPTSKQVRGFLSRVIAKVGTAPKYLITDSGTQFTCDEFRLWCMKLCIRHRRGTVGQSGSIAIIERFFRTLKDGCTRRLHVVPLVQRAFRRELTLFVNWYNEDRPHIFLKGATPNEVYFKRRHANRAPRFEPRSRWPRGSPCAAPQTLVKGQPGARIECEISFVAGRRHLPLVNLLAA